MLLQVEDRYLPAGQETGIAFRLPEPDQVLGFQFTLSFDPAWVEVSRVEGRDLPGEGMFYYTLRTAGQTLTRKFIVVNSRR